VIYETLCFDVLTVASEAGMHKVLYAIITVIPEKVQKCVILIIRRKAV